MEVSRGFMSAPLYQGFVQTPRSVPLGSRGTPMELSARTQEFLSRAAQAEINRADISGDLAQIVADQGAALSELARSITSTQTGFPVRENLEAESKILVPLDTPVRNRLPRVPGSGLSSLWRQTTSLGGGWGTSLDQPGGGSAQQAFFAESGAPANQGTVYAAKSAAYKLLGTLRDVTGFAMAGGANFQNQLNCGLPA